MTILYSAGGDFAFRSDHAGLVIVARDGDQYDVVEVDELRPEKGKPLVPSAVCAHFAGILGRYGIREIGVDGHYVESVREHMREHKVELRVVPTGNAAKVATYLGLRTLVNEQKIRIRHAHLIEQLKAIQKKPLGGGGLDIYAARKKRGGHADAVSALVLAVWMAEQGIGRSYTEVLQMLEQRRMSAGDWREEGDRARARYGGGAYPTSVEGLAGSTGGGYRDVREF